MKGKGKVDASEGTFKGKVLYNNQRIIDIKKTNLNK
jgi:hypothetical protein